MTDERAEQLRNDFNEVLTILLTERVLSISPKVISMLTGLGYTTAEAKWIYEQSDFYAESYFNRHTIRPVEEFEN